MTLIDIVAYISLAAGVGLGILAYENDTIRDQIDDHGFMGYFFLVFIGMCGMGAVYVAGLYLIDLLN